MQSELTNSGAKSHRIPRHSGKQVRCALLLLVTVAGMAGPACRRDDAPPTFVVKISTVLPESHPTAVAIVHFQKRLGELSGKTMRGEVYFNSQLGHAGEVLELCRMGDVEIGQVSAANLTVYVPLANALAMPFIWKDSVHQATKLNGQVGELIRERARELDLEILAYFDAGTRNITTKAGPVRRPEDIRGMKIRVMNAPLMVGTINALGASAMALNQGEVYTALQMGVIDGWENNPMTIATTRMHETGCIHFAWTRHFSIPDLFVAGEPFLKRLTSEQRSWVDQAAAEAVDLQWQIWAESEEQALEDMRSSGMQLNEVDVEPFRALVEPIYEQYYQRYGPQFKQLCEEILGT